jgi:NADH-quinone oxidoreductase subunit J
MSATSVIFYILAALVLTFGALTVFSRHIFRAAVFLLLSLIGIAGIYILMEMDFIAAIQIIVYVGGIVVLIIFSIFLTHQAGEKLKPQRPIRIFFGTLLSVAGLAFTTWIIMKNQFVPTKEPAIENSVRTIGKFLLDYKSHGYVFPFEVISILLLAALIGSIVIAMKDKKKDISI